MNKVTLTIFTDPMMGLSYESEPVIRRLETHFGEALSIRYAMCVLVGDVRHFMVPEDMAETPELTLANYNRRLAGIYRKEEEINGMPIAMEECRLFDMQHLTSELRHRGSFQGGGLEVCDFYCILGTTLNTPWKPPNRSDRSQETAL